MADLGTFEWAKEEIMDVREKYSDFSYAANEIGISVVDLVGRENLAALENRLRDVYSSIERPTNKDEQSIYEEGLDLIDIIVGSS